jgi:hypothetical protein
MKKKITFLLFLILLSCLDLISQESDDGEFNFIKSKSGVRVLYNVTGSNFYFDMTCDYFKEIDLNDMLFVFDDMMIQITPVPISAYTKTASNSMNDSMALVLHQISEMKNIRAQIKGKFNIDYLMWTDTNSRLCNSWEFAVPGIEKDTSSEKITRQIFATTRIGDRVLMLSCALTKQTDRDSVLKKVKGAFLTIYQQQDKIDPEELRKKMTGE